jgi:hypothetical protein
LRRDDLPFEIVADHPRLARADPEHFHCMTVSSLLGLAEPVLALNLDVVETVFEGETYNLGALLLGLGTARMGSDPDRSVVNEWGRSHDVKNLFIVDGSVFVTSGGVNPTSTIQALALYVADQMKQRLANLFD